MRSVFLAMLLIASCLSTATAQARRPVEYRGLSARTNMMMGTGQQTSTIILRFHNPNGQPVEIRDIRCEVHRDRQLVNRFSIARIIAQPGDTQFEAPERIEGYFNRASCRPGKLL